MSTTLDALDWQVYNGIPQTFGKKNLKAKSSKAAEGLSMGCSPSAFDAVIISVQVISCLLTNSEWTSYFKAERFLGTGKHLGFY